MSSLSLSLFLRDSLSLSLSVCAGSGVAAEGSFAGSAAPSQVENDARESAREENCIAQKTAKRRVLESW